MATVGFAVTVAGRATEGSIAERVREMYCRHACALLRSMVAEMPGLSAPVLVFYDKLTPDQKKRFKKVYPSIRFQKVPLALFKRKAKTDPRFFALEAFNPTYDLDRIILLDADMICVGNADVLIYEVTAPISMWREPSRPCFNSGCVVITRSLLTAEWYERVLDTKVTEYGHDQAILNQLFGSSAAALPANTQRFVDEKTVPPWGCTFLHFIHKPGVAPHKISAAAKALVAKYMPEGMEELARK